MKTRRVTRPTALQDAQGDDGEHGDQWGPSRRSSPTTKNTLLIPWTLVLLGGWLVLAPFTFGRLS